jgi:release factor glutamine methyltransferase
LNTENGRKALTMTTLSDLSAADREQLGAAACQRFTARLSHLAQALSTLPDKPEETAASALRALWHAAAGQPMSVELASAQTLPALDAAQDAQLDALIAQRVAGVPLAHITGFQRFMGLELIAGPQALIPRAETALLGQAALGKVQAAAQVQPASQAPVLVIDVCTGSGNLAVALAHGEPWATVHAADLSEEAVALAHRNIDHLGLGARVQAHCGDFLTPFANPAFLGKVDVLVCNPPYISSGKVKAMPDEIASHEPHLAFDGGPFGIRILQRLMSEAPAFLRPGGWLAFEVGLGQGPAVLQRLGKMPEFERIETQADAEGQIRVVLALRAPA